MLARRGARRRGPASEARRSLRRRLLARERPRHGCVYQAHRVVRCRRRLRPARAGVGRHDKPGGRRSCFARTPRRRRVVLGRGKRRLQGSDGQGKYYRTGDGGVPRRTARSGSRAASTTRSSAAAGGRSSAPSTRRSRPRFFVAACRFVLVDDALVACCARARGRSATLALDAVLGPCFHGPRRDASSACQPAAVLFATELPRTRTDKVDRRACQAAAARALRDASPQGRRPPNTRVTQAVAFAWREIGVAPPGRDAARDDTFEVLGGDSLLALRACRRLEARLCDTSFAGDGDDYYGDLSRDAFHPRHLLRQDAGRVRGVPRAGDQPGAAAGRPRPRVRPRRRVALVVFFAEAAADPFNGDVVLAALDEALGAAAEARRAGALAALLGTGARPRRPRLEPDAGQTSVAARARAAAAAKRPPSRSFARAPTLVQEIKARTLPSDMTSAVAPRRPAARSAPGYCSRRARPCRACGTAPSSRPCT